jgi:hypothetical protein
MKRPTLFATIGIALCLASLPAVALVSAGGRPSMWEQRSLPQWPVAAPTTVPPNRGLPIMTLEWAGLLQPQALPVSACVAQPASGVVAVPASRRLAAVAARHRKSSATHRIWARTAIYARLKPPSRLSLQPHDTAVFIGGLY